MKIKNMLLLILIFAGVLAFSVASVSADQTVNIGGNDFTIPSGAQNLQTSDDSCNFTVENVSASIIKINPNDLDSYIHSNRSKKYEIVRLSGDQANNYRFEDRLHNQNGVLTPIQKGSDSYIFKVYVYDSFSGSNKNAPSSKMHFIGIFRGFLYKNGFKESIGNSVLPI